MNGKTGNRSFGGKRNGKKDKSTERQNSRRLSLSDTFTISNFDEVINFFEYSCYKQVTSSASSRGGRASASHSVESSHLCLGGSNPAWGH